MRLSRDTYRGAVLLLVCLIFVPVVHAEDELPEKLSLDWIHSEAARGFNEAPNYNWCGESTLLRYDRTQPDTERTLEMLDPASGEVQATVDRAKALESLGDAASTEDELRQPMAITPDCAHGLYRIKGDFYLLDFAASTFTHVMAGKGREAVRLAPDGKWVGYVEDNDLYAVEVETQHEKRLTHDGTDTIMNGTLSWVYWEELFGRRDRGYEFSPDASKIAFLQFDDSPVDIMTFVDPNPNVTRVVQQRYPKAGTANPKVRAGIIDVASGKTTWIDLGANPYEYLVRLVWLPDSSGVVVQALDRPQQTLDVFLADAANGKARHLFRETDPAWIDVHDDMIFLADGRHFLWVSDRDDHSHIFLYELKEDGAGVVRQLTQGDWSVAGGARRGDGMGGAVAAVDEDGGKVYFSAKKASHLETQVYSVPLAGGDVTRVTPEEGTHRTQWSRDGGYFIDGHSSFTRPGATVLRQGDGKILRTLVEPDTKFADHFGFVTPEVLTVKADDGFELPATLYKPKDFDPSKRYPVIVNVYGGPAAPRVRNAYSGNFATQLLLQEGFLVYTADPRTSTAMGKPTTRGLVKEFYGEREANDLLAAVRWLKTQPFVDGDRVGITGWSGGGTTTVLAMTQSKEFRAGIAGAGVYDWHLYDTIYTERYMKHPQNNEEGYKKTSLVQAGKNLHGRLMLIHGSGDDNVHPQNTWQLVDELIEAGIVFDLMIYPMRPHGVRDRPGRKHLDMVRMEFWKRELGGS